MFGFLLAIRTTKVFFFLLFIKFFLPYIYILFFLFFPIFYFKDMNKWYNPKLLAKETPIFLELIHNLRQSSLNEKPNPSVQPFFFQKTVEKEPPVNPVDFQTLYKELEENLYKGVKKLNHPFNFAAFTGKITLNISVFFISEIFNRLSSYLSAKIF